jgi:hypothetical protein
MNKIFSLFIIFLLFASCGQNTSENNENKEKDTMTFENTSSIMSDSLYKCLDDYIYKVDGFFIDKEWLYYHIFFFSKDKINYFSIWTFTAFTNFKILDTTDYKYYLDTINNRKILIIDKEENQNPLFTATVESQVFADQENNKTYMGPIYDGSWYPETYTYVVENGDIIIIKADSLLYESAVDSNFIKFENRYITLKNGYREKISSIIN